MEVTHDESLHSRIFHENLTRVYEMFTNYRLLSEVTLKGMITDMKFEKSPRPLDEKGLKVELEWKNDLKVTLEVMKSVSTLNYKHYVQKLSRVKDGAMGSFECSYEFFWNSCEQYTLVVFQIKNVSENIRAVASSMFSLSERELICNRLIQYLETTASSLVNYESILINNSIFKVWSFLLKFQNILPFIGYNINNHEIQIKGSLTMIGSLINILDKSSNRLVMTYFIRKIFMSESRMKLIFESKKVDAQPIYYVKVQLEMLGDNFCLLMIKTRFIEYTPCKYICDIGKKKRSALKYMKVQLDEM